MEANTPSPKARPGKASMALATAGGGTARRSWWRLGFTAASGWEERALHTWWAQGRARRQNSSGERWRSGGETGGGGGRNSAA